MNLKYYASPSDLLDDKTTSPIILHENNGKTNCKATEGLVQCLKNVF